MLPLNFWFDKGKGHSCSWVLLMAMELPSPLDVDDVKVLKQGKPHQIYRGLSLLAWPAGLVPKCRQISFLSRATGHPTASCDQRQSTVSTVDRVREPGTSATVVSTGTTNPDSNRWRDTFSQWQMNLALVQLHGLLFFCAFQTGRDWPFGFEFSACLVEHVTGRNKVLH